MKIFKVSIIWAIIAFLLFPSVEAFATTSGAGPAQETNVLLITVDTLRFDRVGALSSTKIKTPNMDALAKKSLVFYNAYAHSTLTRPSHANIMTGTTPLYHGVSDNPGFRLEKKYPTMAESFKAGGFKTAAFIGAFILDSQFGLDRGFDVYDDMHGQSNIVERRADQVVQSAAAWIAGQGDVWYCWVHLFDPHDPYDPPEPYKSQYADDPYSGEVAFVDAQLGLLFQALEKRGVLDKTIIVLTSDHGEALGEKGESSHGFFAYNAVLHIPLIVYSPGLGPKAVTENAGHTDIFPTLCDLVGLPVPDDLQGESLLPIAEGIPRKNPLIYFESLSPSIFLEAAPLRGYIQGKTKFIDQPIKEVYDLVADPGEDNNLAPSTDLGPLAQNLESLKKDLKGKGTKQDLEGKNQDIRPLMESLGYLSAKSKTKKSYGPGDDLKALQPLIAQLHMAVEESRVGKIDPALAKLKNIIRIRPSYVTAYSAAAQINANIGRLDDAIVLLRKGLEKNPDSLHLLADLSETLIRAKKHSEAATLLEVCVDRDRNNPEYENYLGLAYMGLGSYDKAEERYHKALALDPDMVEAFNNLGFVNLIRFVKSGNEESYQSALAYFDKALAIIPRLENALKGKAAAAEAKAKFDKSPKKSPFPRV